MKKLIVDLDDVICGQGFMNIINQYLNTDYKEEEVKGYYLQDLIDKDKLDDFYRFFFDSNMYNYVVIFPNATRVIEKLNKKYELYICSSFVVPGIGSELGMLLKHKYEWLHTNFPFIKPNQLIFMSSKHLIDADIRIDDRLSNLEGPGSLKILYTSYHNRNITDKELKQLNIIRVNGWLEIEKLLEIVD